MIVMNERKPMEGIPLLMLQSESWPLYQASTSDVIGGDWNPGRGILTKSLLQTLPKTS